MGEPWIVQALMRIDKDIEGLFEIIPSFDHITAVAVDKETEVCGKRLAVNEHERAFLEVANPEVVVCSRLRAYTHLLL
ncbi:MAG: hypothetical protein HS127_11185 [Planctomycetia bacterium]|nr:hypothetical protein [Planctomycetia bacterium]